jgi:hypothetical protein
MQDTWTSTVASLAGRKIASPSQWPASHTRRVELLDDPVPCSDTPQRVGDPDREVLEMLGGCPMSGGELAYMLGLNLESAYQRISRLHARGLLRRNGRLWERAVA